MKYLKFFSEGFHVFEDVCSGASKEPRLSVSGHGIAGGSLANLESRTLNPEARIHGLSGVQFIEPEKLLAILNRYFKHDMPKYRHIRLLFCYSADRDRWGSSFAANFSRLLPNPERVIVEAYQGVIHMNTVDYQKRTNSFEDLSELDWSSSSANYNDPKRILTSDYDIDVVNQFLFNSMTEHSEAPNMKKAFWNSVEEFEDFFETCNPVQMRDILASRVFFRNGRSSKNITDFL
ncbi:hypothetical protein [Xenorhabdus hominickii]|nr:hypothetical protein [Xenorhabdus hominickii]PHM57399.1 hypothetical protein Xhom_00366 [Xenorhabdus hominickii]